MKKKQSIASIVSVDQRLQAEFFLQQFLCCLEGSLNPSCFVRIGLTHEMDGFLLPRLTHALHNGGNVVPWVKVVVSSPEYIISPELVNAFFDPLLLNIEVMDLAELFEGFSYQNFFGRVYLAVLGVLKNLVYVALFDFPLNLGSRFPDFFEVIMECAPELSCIHIVIRGKEKVLVASGEVKGLADRQISDRYSPHLLETIHQIGVFVLFLVLMIEHDIGIPPVLSEVHDDFHRRHALAASCQLSYCFGSNWLIFVETLFLLHL